MDTPSPLTPTPTAAAPHRRFTARGALVAIGVAAALLVLCAGDSIGRSATGMEPGLERDVVAAVGRPAGWVADRLPFAAATDQVTGWLSSDEKLGTSNGRFSGARAAGRTARVAPASFSPAQLGARADRRPLHKLLVTGDSMSQPLDAQLARRLAGRAVKTVREPHLGTGISKTFLVDWGKLSAQQAQRVQPEAVVVFLGANEGFPMSTPTGTARCCGAAWAAEYATRARSMMDNYRRGGRTRVLWVLIPAPRDAGRARVARTVNAAVAVAAGAFGAQVTLVDAPALFTPGGRYRSAMPVDGRTQIVRRPDGIHLNDDGAALLTRTVIGDLTRTFSLDQG